MTRILSVTLFSAFSLWAASAACISPTPYVPNPHPDYWIMQAYTVAQCKGDAKEGATLMEIKERDYPKYAESDADLKPILSAARGYPVTVVIIPADAAYPATAKHDHKFVDNLHAVWFSEVGTRGYMTGGKVTQNESNNNMLGKPLTGDDVSKSTERLPAFAPGDSGFKYTAGADIPYLKPVIVGALNDVMFPGFQILHGDAAAAPDCKTYGVKVQ